MTEISFQSRSRVRPWELSKLWYTCGVEVMVYYHFMDAVMKNMGEPCPYDFTTQEVPECTP